MLVPEADTLSGLAGLVSQLGLGYEVWSQMDRSGRWPLQHCDDLVQEPHLRNSWHYTEGGREGGWVRVRGRREDG